MIVHHRLSGSFPVVLQDIDSIRMQSLLHGFYHLLRRNHHLAGHLGGKLRKILRVHLRQDQQMPQIRRRNICDHPQIFVLIHRR